MNREHLMEIYRAAVAAVDPFESVHKALRRPGEKLIGAGTVFQLDMLQRIVVLGGGKAAAGMAAAVEDLLGDLITGGVVIAPYGQNVRFRNIELLQASHPLPDQAGVMATQRVLELARGADKDTLVICILSGGGSALLVAPAEGISLEDKQKTTRLLQRSGASIDEINSVRKHLSAIKGGRLAQAAYPASVLSLVLSDVVGDQLDVIASGPTVPDSSTFAHAGGVLKKYGLTEAVPPAVLDYIREGSAGKRAETAKSGECCFKRTANVIIGGIAQALFAARNQAKALGYVPDLITAEIQGEARETAGTLAGTALRVLGRLKPGDRRCLLFGGETAVTVNGNGKGGRNQELALAFAKEIAGVSGVSMLSAGTDGADGPTDAAGAIVDGTTIEKARQCGIKPETYLENNDSYTFFKKIDLVSSVKHHVITGPTGTNVMDVQVILLEG